MQPGPLTQPAVQQHQQHPAPPHGGASSYSLSLPPSGATDLPKPKPKPRSTPRHSPPTPRAALTKGSPAHPVLPVHGGRLIYASPQDLPSYPSPGLKGDSAAAGIAATLGWANQKQLELWKPGATSASASAAATLAQDYKMPTAWEPERGSAGPKAAALAAQSAGRRSTIGSAGPAPSNWGNSAANQAFKAHPAQPQRETTTWGNSAANQAFRTHATQPPRDTTTATLNRQKSLGAARGAMAGARPRAKSSPLTPEERYPDEANAAANALSAASLAHRPSARAQFDEAGATPYTTMDRQMYTSHPPVKLEVDEQRHADVIHASALAMAKKMYSQQQQVINNTKAAYGDPDSPSSSDGGPRTGQYVNLQEAAYKLAQERLAKLHDEHQQSKDYQDYYRDSAAPQRRFSIRGKLRRRSSSDGQVIEDRKRSQQIRQQMSMFSTKISEVDEDKRRRDREAVLAAAQRNVKAQLQGMDEKVYADTGKVAPSLLSEWELKAHAAAQARSEARKDGHAGMIDIGGGKFMDPKEVDEIAARRVQPVLDEINEKAEKERERQAALRAEEEERRREAEAQKALGREIKEIHQKIKHDQKEKDKARKEEIKNEAKARKEEEKAAKAEQKKHPQEDKGKGKETEIPPEAVVPNPQEVAAPAEEEEESPKEKAGDRLPKFFARPAKLQTKHSGKEHSSSGAAVPPAEKSPKSPKSPLSPPSDDSTPASPSGKVKNWLKTRFSRPRAKSSAEPPEKSFVGGHALIHTDGTGSMTSLDNRSTSVREVALAGRAGATSPQSPPPATGLGFVTFVEGEEAGESSAVPQQQPQVEQPQQKESEWTAAGATTTETPNDRGRDAVSPVSTGSGGGASGASSIGTSDDDDDETFVEARESLPVPRPIRDPAGKKSSSPVRDSRFLENLE